LRFTALLAIARIAVVAVVPPLLAYGAALAGPRTRRLVRVAFTVPLALYMPVSLALAWRLVFAGARNPLLIEPSSAPWIFLFLDGLYTLGLAAALGLFAYPAALAVEGAPASRSSRLAFLAVWLASVIAALASALQSFTWSYALTNGGPGNATTTLMLLFYKLGLQNLQLGPAAAIGVFILVLLAPLGLALAALAAFGGVRLEAAAAGPGEAGQRAGPPYGAALLAVALLIAGGACALSALPLPVAAARAGDFGRLGEAAPLGRVLLSTLGPPLVSVLLVQVPVAYTGALAIGALRPLGRWSEALLLPFGPWLFVGAGPLSIAFLTRLRDAELLGTFVAQIPPIGLTLPMLFILALFFKGQSARRRPGAGSFLDAVIRPSLPLAGILASLALFAALGDLYWPLLTGFRPEASSASVALARLAAQFGFEFDLMGAALLLFSLPPFVLFFTLFSAFQLGYFERGGLALRAGESASL
jgi:hypothetical protein